MLSLMALGENSGYAAIQILKAVISVSPEVKSHSAKSRGIQRPLQFFSQNIFILFYFINFSVPCPADYISGEAIIPDLSVSLKRNCTTAVCIVIKN